MGLSIAITGTIILFTLMAVMFTLSTMVNSLVTMEDVSSKASIIKESISQTSIKIMSVSAVSGNDFVQFSLANNGTEKLWNYDDFTLLVTYDADIGGVKTKVTEDFNYNPSNSFKIPTAYLIPESELSGGFDSTNGCANATPWLCIDETPLTPPAPDDSDYVWENNVNNIDQVAVEYGLSNEAIPNIVIDVTVHYTYSEDGDSFGSNPDLDITLLENSAVTIATWTEFGELPNRPAFGVSDQQLTAGEIASIGNYDDLSLEFNINCASAGCGAGNEDVNVSWGIVEIQGINTGGSSNWVITDITNDIKDPRIINNEESANLVAQLSNPIFANGDVIVSISTDKGVTASTAISAS